MSEAPQAQKAPATPVKGITGLPCYEVFTKTVLSQGRTSRALELNRLKDRPVNVPIEYDIQLLHRFLWQGSELPLV